MKQWYERDSFTMPHEPVEQGVTMKESLLDSTQKTIVKNTNYHLFTKIDDNDNIYLKLVGVECNIEISELGSSVVISIPDKIWHEIRTYDNVFVHYGKSNFPITTPRCTHANLLKELEKLLSEITGRNLIITDAE